MSDLLRYKDNQKYLFFDFETEGLSLLHRNKPWQLSFILCQNNKIIKEHDCFPWWEDLNVGEGAAIVTRFNYQDYKRKSKNPEEILNIFEQYLYDETVIPIGHNVLGFDVYLHNIYRNKLNKKTDYSYLPRLLDTNALAKAWKMNISIDRKNLLAFQYRMNNTIFKGVKTNLKQLGKDLELPEYLFENLHDGLNDIKLNFEVWKKLVWKIEI